MADWIFASLGLIILLLAGDSLVRGAVNLSLRLGVPALIVSLTIVAFGTSAPELLIAIEAVVKGSAGIALGNVVGSNTANILLVLGFPALLATMHTSQCNTRKSYLQMIGASLLFIALAYRGVFDRFAALVLLAALFLMLADAMRDARRHRQDTGDTCEDAEELEGADPNLPGWKIAVFLGLGMVGLPLGADLLVDSAKSIAHRFNVPEPIIGLTLVALGTSLPELATTTMAALRRQADVALGNVIGSNMFNLLAIIGVAGMIGPIHVPAGFVHFDLWVMLMASLMLIPFVFLRRDINRLWGIVLSGLYVAYIAVLLV